MPNSKVTAALQDAPESFSASPSLRRRVSPGIPAAGRSFPAGAWWSAVPGRRQNRREGPRNWLQSASRGATISAAASETEEEEIACAGWK